MYGRSTSDLLKLSNLLRISGSATARRGDVLPCSWGAAAAWCSTQRPCMSSDPTNTLRAPSAPDQCSACTDAAGRFGPNSHRLRLIAIVSSSASTWNTITMVPSLLHYCIVPVQQSLLAALSKVSHPASRLAHSLLLHRCGMWPPLSQTWSLRHLHT